MRAIDADVLFREMEKAGWYDNADRDEVAEELVMNAPTIEPERTGRWIRTGRTNIYYGKEIQCSLCGDTVMVQYIEDELYCRHCGAKMEVEHGIRTTASSMAE